MRALTPALLLFLAAGPVAAADDLKTRLDRGDVVTGQETVEGSEVPAITFQAVIDAPPERVWAIVEDCGNYQKHMPRIAASKEETREGDEVTCRVTADMPFPLRNITSLTRAVHRVEPGRRWSREWTLVEGDYDLNQGSWVLTPWPGEKGRTLVRYRIQAKPKIPVPQSLARRTQLRALGDLVQRLRELSADPRE